MSVVKDNIISVDRNVLEEYSIFIDVVSHERDKIFWNSITSDKYDELVDYLDN